jgi:mannose-6-phosphate isomerase-like protein (cupin superfamily)
MTDPTDLVAPFATLVTSSAVDALPWRPLAPYEDVDYKLLWQSGKSVAGLMRLAPGAVVAPHTHVRSHHHLWIVDGIAETRGEPVGTGSYVHVPAGVEHGLRAVGDAGCTVLYLYLRDDSPGT